MMMGDIPGVGLVIAVAGGVLIGFLYFATLWWTVRMIAAGRRSAWLVAGSFLIRAVAAAGGIVFFSGGEPVRLVMAVAGFLVARMITIRLVGAPQSAVTVLAEAGPESPEDG